MPINVDQFNVTSSQLYGCNLYGNRLIFEIDYQLLLRVYIFNKFDQE